MNLAVQHLVVTVFNIGTLVSVKVDARSGRASADIVERLKLFVAYYSLTSVHSFLRRVETI
jgi:hypothetical protein